MYYLTNYTVLNIYLVIFPLFSSDFPIPVLTVNTYFAIVTNWEILFFWDRKSAHGNEFAWLLSVVLWTWFPEFKANCSFKYLDFLKLIQNSQMLARISRCLRLVLNTLSRSPTPPSKKPKNKKQLYPSPENQPKKKKKSKNKNSDKYPFHF